MGNRVTTLDSRGEIVGARDYFGEKGGKECGARAIKYFEVKGEPGWGPRYQILRCIMCMEPDEEQSNNWV